MTTRTPTERLRYLFKLLGDSSCPIEIVLRNTSSRNGVPCWMGEAFVEGSKVAGVKEWAGEPADGMLIRLLAEALDTIETEKLEEQYQ